MNPIHMLVQPITRNFTVVAGAINQIFVDEHYAGDDLVLQFAFVDEDGDAVDISTYTTLAAGIYPLAGGAQVLAFTAALVGGGTGGILTLTLAAAASAALDGDYQIELQVVGTGIKYTPVTGVIRVHETY